MLFMHGTPGSRLEPYLGRRALAELGVRLISFDRPGYGGSDRREFRAVSDVASDVVTIADYPGAEQTGVAFSGGMGPERAWHALAEAAELIEAGRFRLPVAQTFPLADIAEAHRVSETGHPRGKLVLIVSEG